MVCAVPVTSFNGPKGLCLVPVAPLYRDNMSIVCLARWEGTASMNRQADFWCRQPHSIYLPAFVPGGAAEQRAASVDDRAAVAPLANLPTAVPSFRV